MRTGRGASGGALPRLGSLSRRASNGCGWGASKSECSGWTDPDRRTDGQWDRDGTDRDDRQTGGSCDTEATSTRSQDAEVIEET